jgi:peptidoglycan hydrolase-like protein with peptidoglycan-binding domain
LEAISAIVMSDFRRLLKLLASPLLVWVLSLFFLAGLPPASVAQSASSKATAKKPAAAKKSVGRKTTARKPMRRRTARRTRAARVPMTPSSERVKEIQQALLDAGYMESEPDGKWGDQSMAALKRFQEDHSITPTGRINSLSLIALGLGPQRGPAPGPSSVLEPAATSEPDGGQPDSPSAARDADP